MKKITNEQIEKIENIGCIIAGILYLAGGTLGLYANKKYSNKKER